MPHRSALTWSALVRVLAPAVGRTETQGAPMNPWQPEPCRPLADAQAPGPQSVCVVGASISVQRAEPLLAALAAQGLEVIRWTLDGHGDLPPARADWAEGLIVLDAELWAQPGLEAQLRSLVRLAWRCGRTLALCGDATRFAAQLRCARPPACEAEDGLFLCDAPPGIGLAEAFVRALASQPHRRT